MWLLPLLALASGEPSDATRVYYNARMALEDDQPLEVVKLWLLRNAMADASDQVSVHDPDFHSVTWAALGELGVCPDGLPNDKDGAGLWPVALHNWVVLNASRRARPQRPRPFDAFAVGRQMRFVSIDDVLAAREMKEVSLFRGRCLRHRLELALAGEMVTADLTDRQVTARLLLHLVDKAEGTLAHDRVRGLAALEARRFDLNLQLTALAAREARLEARSQGRLGRLAGLSRESVEAMRAEAPTSTLDPSSEAARILHAAVGWSVDEWMSLSAERRRFVFVNARQATGESERLDAVALGVIDALADRGEGEEVARWIALRTADPAHDPGPVWRGERGQRLLALDDAAGFDERAVIALHRGVQQLETGDLPGALRSMAYALQRAPESTASDEVARISRRWLSYVAGLFEITDDLLITLEELVPVRDFAVILEDLMWRAAFHADRASFDRALRFVPGRGALRRRAELLDTLASGDVGRFSTRIRAGMTDAPSETLRFVDMLLDRLELEDGDVRAMHLPTLRNLETVLLATQAGGGTRQERAVDALLARCAAIREGVGGGSNPWDRAVERVRSLDPGAEVFVGAVRLAPVDPLPWPFEPEDVPAPSAFEPLELRPEMWRDAAGEPVFGWSIEG